MKLSKVDFNAGSPYSCWLKEKMTGEVGAYLYGFENRGLIKKHKIYVDNITNDIIMNAKKFDDFPEGLQKVAVDIIRAELDKTFEK